MARITATSGQGIIGLSSKLELSYQASIVQAKSQSGTRRAQRRGPLLYNLTVEVEPARLNSDRYYQIMEQIMLLNYGANTLEFTLDREVTTGFSITSPRGGWDFNNPLNFRVNNEEPGSADTFLTPKTAGQTGQSITFEGAFSGTFEDNGTTAPADGRVTNCNINSDPSTTTQFHTQSDCETAGGIWAVQTGTTIGRIFDYVQFEGSTKVYQLTADAVSDRAGPISADVGEADPMVTTDAYSGDVTFNLNTPLVASPDMGSSFNVLNRGVRVGRECLFHMAMMEKPNITYLPGNIVEFGEFVFEEVIETT